MKMLDRFIQYVTIDTQSDENSDTHPSTEKQKILGSILVEQMKEIGLADCHMDELGYVYGWLEASKGMEDKDIVGLIAHMDTAPSFLGAGVKPRIIREYDGKDIVLKNDVNSGMNIVMSTKVFPELGSYVGEDLIVTDGTTLLGADDKAGIAEILTAVSNIVENNIPHGRIAVAFTPDEEIGQGADYFDIEKFGADYAYTVDGGKLGELEYENFNAASAKVIVNGVNIHPGEAKNKMKNASLIAMEYNSLLPQCETPAHTEGYEGFYHLTGMAGDEEKATLSYIIRDHSKEIFEKRKNVMKRNGDFLNEKYGSDTICVEIKDSYYNMKDKIMERMDIVERAKAAFCKCDVEPIIVPIRGGTDGARLSYEGLLCPNLSTGGVNFHGKYEFISINSMEKMVEVLTCLLKA